MAKDRTVNLIDSLQRAVLAGGETERTDGQLLEDYIGRRDEVAVAALVRRHGSMVWGVCRRVLHSEHDAEDAFQATFLVLVRKAASIVPRERVGSWLYGVAYQTALKARATKAKRQARERQVKEMPEPAAAPERDLWPTLEPLLDQELSRLPDKYRIAVVLCDLEGKTGKEAARQLEIPEGTLSTRLRTARTMLAKRLARHGLGVSSGALAAVLSQQGTSACVPSAVVSSTIKAASLFAAGQAAGGISLEVATLTQGALKAMLLTRLKKLAAVVVVLVMGGFGAGLSTYPLTQAKPPKGEKSGQEKGSPAPRADRATEKKDKTLIAWGKEIDGLQAGIQLESPVGEISRGDGVVFVIFVRNVSKEEVTVKYVPPTGMGHSAEKLQSRELEFSPAYNGGRPLAYEQHLKPGEKWELSHLNLLTRRPTSREGTSQWAALEPGKYKVSCSDVLLQDLVQERGQPPRARKDRLSTGKLEITIAPAKNKERDEPKEGPKKKKD